MKYILILSCSLALLSCSGTAEQPVIVIDSVVNKNNNMDLLSNDPPAYDSALAAAIGADEYGMRQYVLAFLKRGPNRNQDSAEAEALQQAHLDNIMKMADEGKLVVAGPFMDDGDVRGIYIFNVATVEEAEALTKTDPAIIAGRLTMELHPWYGSAALVLNNNLHKRVEKKNVAE